MRLPGTNDIDRIADWVELFVLYKFTAISKSKIISLFTKEDVNVTEEDVDSAFEELRRRLKLYGDLSPFEIHGNQIHPNIYWKENPALALCLYYSTYGVGTTPKGSARDMGTKIFEDLIYESLAKFFDCSGTVFGFPSDLTFSEQLDQFAKFINENRYDNPGPHDKDRDVDIVFYKILDSVRGNCILVFVQCAAGKSWDTKKMVAIESYRRYIGFSLKAVIASLAVTQVISIDDWKNACDDYGLIIDRARLFNIITSNEVKFPKSMEKELLEWCKEKLSP